jgi:trans-aconitate 2-methyltransferase
MSHDSIRTTFDAWAAAGRAEEMERRHLAVARQVIDPMPVRPGMQLLDHGCGGGWATRILGKKAPGAQAIGIDVSPGMIAKAEALSDWTSRARFECMPFEALTFGDRRFDRVFSMEALYYAVDLTAALAELFRVTKPGGTVDVLVDRYRESPATERWSADLGLPHLAWLGSEEWRERLAAAGFEPGEVGRLRAAEDDTPAPDDHGDLAEVRAAGTLWLHATRPA